MSNVINLRPENIFLIRVSIDNTHPEIWREIEVEQDTKLPDLHKIIQTSMGWTNSHLHGFRKNEKIYSEPDDDSLSEYIDYSKIKLNSVISNETEKFIYDYDFGDDWTHTITLKKIIPRDEGITYPHCTNGEMHSPPEDCGGPWGYKELLEIIKNPSHDEYEDTIEWLGGEFKTDDFNKEKINKMLKSKNYGVIEY